jgi:hypothetical protein
LVIRLLPINTATAPTSCCYSFWLLLLLLLLLLLQLLLLLLLLHCVCLEQVQVNIVECAYVTA